MEETGVVTTFGNSKCYGKTGALMSGTKGTVVGFTRSDLYKFNSYYKYIWAVQVPPGYTLELFSDYHYGGTSKKTFTGELDTDGAVKC
jgi:hypothetical protein